MHAVLIEHPQAGLILFECGPGRGIKDDETGQTYEEIWGSSVTEYFCRGELASAEIVMSKKPQYAKWHVCSTFKIADKMLLVVDPIMIQFYPTPIMSYQQPLLKRVMT